MAINGHCDPQFAAVRDVFEQNFAAGEEFGAAFALYSGDELVVDLWGGVANHKTGAPWVKDTSCLAFSCTKAITATAALMLWERGLYDMEAPVTSWWPEFSARGAVTKHLLTHQVGLPAFDQHVDPSDAADPAAMADLLARQEPEWEPGTDHGYHVLTYGWLAGEIVRRHSGQSVGDFVAGEIAGPRGLDLHVGADESVRARAARLTTRNPADTPPAGGTSVSSPDNRAAAMIAAATDPGSLLNRALYNPSSNEVPGGANNPIVLSAGWPAMGMVTTASALAGFYRDLVAGRILRPQTLTAGIKRQVNGPDRVLMVDSSFGLGYMRPSLVYFTPRAARESAFGHTGMGGSIGLGDPEHGLGLAYVMNRLGDGVSGDFRAFRLVDAVYKAALG